MLSAPSPTPPQEILSQYRKLTSALLSPLAGGLINTTYLARGPHGSFVLQRLHPIFAASVHIDIEAITRHLDAAGLLTPLLVRSDSGELCCTDSDGHVWRLFTYIAGTTVHALTSPIQAENAGALVGRFHAALATLSHTFSFSRPGVHNTAEHLAGLVRARDSAVPFEGYDFASQLADDILDAANFAAPFPDTQVRIIHGDLKISNILFDDAGVGALCLVDLDTLQNSTVPIEMGDALRSWTNPRGESVVETVLDLALFDGAMRGYLRAARALLIDDELAALVPAWHSVAVELAARFCRDIFEDRYFGWDPAQFPSRRAHNLVRARGQLHLSKMIFAQQAELATKVQQMRAASFER